MIGHSAIIDILEAKGFPEQWCHWIQDILSSGTSSMLLNGISGKEFHCKRRVKQGDPLSPLLFVLVADLLQSIVNKENKQDLFGLSIPNREVDNFPIEQYVDDTAISTS